MVGHLSIQRNNDTCVNPSSSTVRRIFSISSCFPFAFLGNFEVSADPVLSSRRRLFTAGSLTWSNTNSLQLPSFSAELDVWVMHHSDWRRHSLRRYVAMRQTLPHRCENDGHVTKLVYNINELSGLKGPSGKLYLQSRLGSFLLPASISENVKSALFQCLIVHISLCSFPHFVTCLCDSPGGRWECSQSLCSCSLRTESSGCSRRVAVV